MYLGQTKGSKGSKQVQAKTQKAVYVQPLAKNYQSILLNGPQPIIKPQRPLTPSTFTVDDPFTRFWQSITEVVVGIANEYDRSWQKRRRVLNTLLIILFIFRLVFSKGRQGYDITLTGLWEQCRILGIELPQLKPVRASTMCSARAKVDEKYI